MGVPTRFPPGLELPEINPAVIEVRVLNQRTPGGSIERCFFLFRGGVRYYSFMDLKSLPGQLTKGTHEPAGGRVERLAWPAARRPFNTKIPFNTELPFNIKLPYI